MDVLLNTSIGKRTLLTKEEASEESLLLWEALGTSLRLSNNFEIRSNPIFTIKVFCGGLNGIQLGPFKVALSSIIDEYKKIGHYNHIRISVKYISNQDVTNNQWLPKHLIDFLLDSDLHFILTHIHQGLTSKNIGWIIPSLLKHLKRLKYHKGFPMMENLFCPVFTQDKIKYIRFLGEKFSIPTFEIRIAVPGTVYRSTELSAIKEWCANNNIDGCGWVVKAPFTTNSSYVKFMTQIDDVIDVVTKASEHLIVGFCQIPYLMIQPCLYNRKEYKVICKNGSPAFVASIGSNSKKCQSGVNRAFSSGKHESLMQFCREVIKEFKTNCPYAITNGLFRIDVFQFKSGNFVVNELESLEATFYSTNHDNEVGVLSYLESYWTQEINDLMQSTLHVLSDSISNNPNILYTVEENESNFK